MENDPINAVDPFGLDALLIIHRDPNPNGDPRNSPGTLIAYENGVFVGSTRVNENGYSDGQHGIPPGRYVVLPKNNYDLGDAFGAGQPSGHGAPIF